MQREATDLAGVAIGRIRFGSIGDVCV